MKQIMTPWGMNILRVASKYRGMKSGERFATHYRQTSEQHGELITDWVYRGELEDTLAQRRGKDSKN